MFDIKQWHTQLINLNLFYWRLLIDKKLKPFCVETCSHRKTQQCKMSLLPAEGILEKYISFMSLCCVFEAPCKINFDP